MSSLRLERVRELLKRELGEIIRREIPVGEVGLVTVNEVRISNDLHSATVFVGILGNEEQQKRGIHYINEHRKRLQGMIGKAVILKYTPQLKFILDNSVRQGDKVLQILKELETTSPQPDPSEDEITPEDH